MLLALLIPEDRNQDMVVVNVDVRGAQVEAHGGNEVWGFFDGRRKRKKLSGRGLDCEDECVDG